MHALAKIIAKHAGRTGVEVGEIVNVVPDYVMLNDRGAARAYERFREMGGERIYAPERCVVVFDHHYPPIRQQDADSQRKTRGWMKEQGIAKFHPGEGIGHVIFPEKGYAFPGALIFGTDSHTTTNGAVGCLGTGFGATDVGSFLALGYNWLRVPEVIRYDLHGELKPLVSAKDITLKILQDYGEDGAVYQGVEFAGPLLSKLTMEQRLVLSNMVIEMGGKSGYVQPDDVTRRWLEGRVPESRWDLQTTDSDRDYAKIIDIDVSEIEPLVAIPHDLSNVVSARSVGDVQIDEAILGTCTGGRIEDFRIVAGILEGRHIAPHTRMMVNPGSQAVYRQAIKEGLIDIIVQAGGTIGVSGCGPCSGCHQGMLGDAENAITTSSRNFRGRSGSLASNLYVAAPATVAASAIAGRIVCPVEFTRN